MAPWLFARTVCVVLAPDSLKELCKALRNLHGTCRWVWSTISWGMQQTTKILHILGDFTASFLRGKSAYLHLT